MSVAAPLKLEDRRPGRIRPDLESLREVLDTLGNPQHDFRSVLIVGTNGKGSTAAMLEAVFREHGLTTGLFTSPHLVRVEERIRINGALVETDVLARHLDRLEAYPDLTYFETVTAAAFLVFAESAVDVAVLEAGMGGSWDATRLAGSAIAGLTNVGSDHSRWLGRGPGDIARDKGRALAAATRSLIGDGVPPAVVADLEAPDAQPAAGVVGRSSEADGQISLAWDGGAARVRVPLPGRHQETNVQLAVALAVQARELGWVPTLDARRVSAAIEKSHWPGRLTVHRVAGRRVLMDCAHNLEAARALAAHLAACGERYHLVFSCLDDKPVEEMAQALRPHVGTVVVCELDDERAMDLGRLVAAFPGAQSAGSPLEALAAVPDPVLAAGSIRLVGALLAESTTEEVG